MPRPLGFERSGRSILWVLLIAVLTGNGGCVQNDGSRFNPFRAVAPSISDDDERDIGMQFDRELQTVVTVIHDPIVSDFINELGQSIVSQIEPQPFIYRFRIIDDPSLNAFAVPGGYVYFHSGTILAASNINELAGVMGHEIAHVKQHHYARMRKKSQIPDLLVGIAGMAAAAAAKEPGLLVAAQAANVAMKLKYSREYESEADQFGSVYMVRAGYDPVGITHFFERILEEQKRHPNDMPPYLFSHPEVEDRIESVELAAESLKPTREPNPELAKLLPVVQARLEMLVDSNRASLHTSPPMTDRPDSQAALDEASALAEADEIEAALARLRAAERANPDDPRVPFQIGELHARAGRYQDAVTSYRRTLGLDASRARVFFQLGLAHRELGERHRAVYAFEQAALRAGESSALRERAQWEVYKITFTIIPEAGFTDGSDDANSDGPLGDAREEFAAGTRRFAWRARLHPRFESYSDTFTLRWTGPDGQVLQEKGIKNLSGPWIGSTLKLEEGARPGSWTAELLLADEVIDRRTLTVVAR